MASARYIEPKMLWNDAEIDLTQYVKSISYTDNASGTLDDIQIELADPDGDWCGNWQPNKEDDLDVSLYYHNWYVQGQTQYYHCGNFTLDDVSYSDNPRTLSVGAVSEPADSGFKSTAVTKTWEAVTITGIANEIMAKYGMSSLYFTGTDYYIASIEQDGQSDSEFLQSLCSDYGFAIKIYKKSLVIFNEEEYEARGTAFTIYPTIDDGDRWTAPVPGWSWNSTLQGTYTGGTISYTDEKTGEDIEVTIGTDERLLVINEKADSVADAELKIKSQVNEANKQAVTFSFTMARADINLVASCNIQVAEFNERMNGKYYVDKVVNKLDSSSGLTQQVTCHKIFDRL